MTSEKAVPESDRFKFEAFGLKLPEKFYRKGFTVDITPVGPSQTKIFKEIHLHPEDDSEGQGDKNTEALTIAQLERGDVVAVTLKNQTNGDLVIVEYRGLDLNQKPCAARVVYQFSDNKWSGLPQGDSLTLGQITKS